MSIPVGLQVVTRFAGRALLHGQKHAPAILTGLGIVGSIASSVMVARATLRLEDVVDKYEEGKRLLNDRSYTQEHSLEEVRKDKIYLNITYGKDLAKIYGPAITMGAVSIACILAAYGIMHRRNAALAAAYKILETTFNKYREEVVDRYGHDDERVIYESSLRKTNERAIEASSNDPHTLDRKVPSQYARFFDEYNPNWRKDGSYNLMFLRAQQNMLNDLLLARGHVFLNEVYSRLGFPHTSAGAVVGWVLSDDGDNFIDFGIYTTDRPEAREFVNGYERSVLLDFNHQGVIYDRI